MQRPSRPMTRFNRATAGLLLIVLMLFVQGCPNRATGTGAAVDDRVDVAVDDLASDGGVADAARDVLDAATVRDAADAQAAMDVRDAADVSDVAARDVLEVLDAAPRDVPPRDVPLFIPFDAIEADAADAGEEPSPPRLIGPLHAMRVSSKRPSLRWELSPGVSGARIELCRDRACSRVLGSFDAIGTEGRPPVELPAGTAFWRARPITTSGGVGTRSSASWAFEVGWRSAPVDTSYGSMKDFNGDGYDDLAASAPNTWMGGVVHIYYGSPEGVGTSPDQTLDPGAPLGVQFGIELATGDINGMVDLVRRYG